MATIQELESFKLSDAVDFHKELNPRLWDDEKLDPEVRDQLLLIAEDFVEYLGLNNLKVEDVTISGSNAAYSYTPHSDLDLHILVDFNNLPNDPVYQELFTAKKTLYNDAHDITVREVPVELYVQDTNQVHTSLGEYSVVYDKWIRIPKKRRANFDQAATKLKYEKLGDLIELAIKSRNPKKVKDTIDLVKRYRKAGLEKAGEFGPENLAFKAIRKQGLIQDLYDLKAELHGEKLSIDEDVTDLQVYKNPSPKQLYRLTQRSAHKHMRGMYHHGDTYWWDGNDAIHKQGSDYLGIPYDYQKRMEAAIDSVSDNYRVGGDDGVPQNLIQKYDIENELVSEDIEKVPSGWRHNLLGYKRDSQTGEYPVQPLPLWSVFLQRYHPKPGSGDHIFYYMDFLMNDYRGALLPITGSEIATTMSKIYGTNPNDELEKINAENDTDWTWDELLEILQMERRKRQIRSATMEASGYIPSEKEKNDPRFKMALSVDVKPNSIKKNAKAFGFKTSRAGIPPQARADGKIAENLMREFKTFLSESAQPKIGYHVTATQNLPVIKKNGIKADKRGNSYVWDSREMAEWFMDFQNDEGQDRTILKIDMSGLDANPDPEAEDMSEWSSRFKSGTNGGAWIISGPIPLDKIIG